MAKSFSIAAASRQLDAILRRHGVHTEGIISETTSSRYIYASNPALAAVPTKIRLSTHEPGPSRSYDLDYGSHKSAISDDMISAATDILTRLDIKPDARLTSILKRRDIASSAAEAERLRVEQVRKARKDELEALRLQMIEWAGDRWTAVMAMTNIKTRKKRVNTLKRQFEAEHHLPDRALAGMDLY